MVQFSVEGYTVKRNPFQDNVVEKAVALGVALTRNPINTNTFAQLCKSLTAKKYEKSVSEGKSLGMLLKGFNISSDIDTQTVTITQILDPTHPDWSNYQDKLFDLAKGGTGSGRRGLGSKMDGPLEKLKHKMGPGDKKEQIVVTAKLQEEEPDAPQKNPQEAEQRRRAEHKVLLIFKIYTIMGMRVLTCNLNKALLV